MKGSTLGLGNFGYRFITGGLRGGYRATKYGAQYATDRAIEHQRRQRALAQFAIQEGLLYDFLRHKQPEVDARIARQRADGENVMRVEWTDGWFNGERCAVRLFETNDPTCIEIFYGGIGGPMGDCHGHVVFRQGNIVIWWLPGANKDQRVRWR